MEAANERRILILALAATALFALLFGLTGLDLDIQARFYAPAAPAGPWPHGAGQPWDFFYRWGTIPGILAAVGAVVVLGASFLSPRWRPHRYPALFLVLVMALGPGLLVNAIGKGLLGRPRPADLAVFGGSWDFHPPFVPGTPGRGRSFLCGHGSMGFYFMALFFVLPGVRGRLALATGALLGLAIGTARVLQGSHFTSDVLIVGTLMLALMAALAPLSRRFPSETAPSPNRKWVVLGTALLASVAVGIFLLSTPVYTEDTWVWRDPAVHLGNPRKTRVWVWPAAPGRRIGADVAIKRGDVVVSAGESNKPLSVHFKINGFGLPGSGRSWKREMDANHVRFTVAPKGIYNEFNGKAGVAVSPYRISSLRLEAGRGTVALDMKGLQGTVTLKTTPDMEAVPGFARSAGGTWKRPGRGPSISLEIIAERIEIR